MRIWWKVNCTWISTLFRNYEWGFGNNELQKTFIKFNCEVTNSKHSKSKSWVLYLTRKQKAKYKSWWNLQAKLISSYKSKFKKDNAIKLQHPINSLIHFKTFEASKPNFTINEEILNSKVETKYAARFEYEWFVVLYT